MKQTTQILVEKFPMLEGYLYAYENIFDSGKAMDSLSDQTEKTFLKLAWFFENPDEYDGFHLGLLYKYLEDDWLVFALDLIQSYFKNDTYLLKDATHSVIVDDDNYLSQSDFARFLSDQGLNYSQNKLAVYLKRGKLPPEDTRIAGKPYWSRRTVEKYYEELLPSQKDKKNMKY